MSHGCDSQVISYILSCPLSWAPFRQPKAFVWLLNYYPGTLRKGREMFDHVQTAFHATDKDNMDGYIDESEFRDVHASIYLSYASEAIENGELAFDDVKNRAEMRASVMFKMLNLLTISGASLGAACGPEKTT